MYEVTRVRISAAVSPLPPHAFMVCTGTALSLLLKSSFNKSESSSEDAGNGTWGIAFIPGCGIANLHHYTCDHYSTVLCPLLSGYSTKEESPRPTPFLWLNNQTIVHNSSLLGFPGHTQLDTHIR